MFPVDLRRGAFKHLFSFRQMFWFRRSRQVPPFAESCNELQLFTVIHNFLQPAAAGRRAFRSFSGQTEQRYENEQP